MNAIHVVKPGEEVRLSVIVSMDEYATLLAIAAEARELRRKSRRITFTGWGKTIRVGALEVISTLVEQLDTMIERERRS